MPSRSAHRLRRVSTIVGCLVGLSACGPIGPLCDPPAGLQKAAGYDWMINGQRYAEPLNAWVRNERLEAFLATAMRADGIVTLRSQYGFQCSPRPLTPPCNDCYSCNGILPKLPDPGEPRASQCSPAGEMLMQVDVGPGSALRAMTYWQREPVEPR